MAVASSLQLSHELGLPKNLKHTSKLKKLDALSFRLLDSVNRQNCPLPSRYNVFVCQSSILPIRASEIPILKTAATALTRSFNASHGNPFVLKLVPGLVIIFFTVWGLGPLMRHGRNFFLKRGDNSWKRSGTHYVTTSYLQPLLLWSGATLVCRALDPVVLSSASSESVKRRLLVFVRSMSTVLAFAHCLSSLIQQVQQFLMETNDPTDTRNMGYQFAGKAVYSAVWVAAVSLFMELLGFSTQKMLTAGGLGTVLLTLAGREIFTNFLSSMMIHATRPFVLNEWIQTKIQGYEVSGTVEHVGWWSPTIIRGDDREAVHIPNHKFTVNVVRNLSQKTHWRIKNHFSISHLDVNKINHIVADMRKVVAKNPQIEQQRLHRRVFLERIDPENQALVILVSCFVKTSRIEEYMCVKEVILLDLLRVISHHRARLATPIRTVHKMNSDEDMENIPFSETIFTHATEATNRPLLLIEPPYKINGDDKTKVHTRSARGNDEQDTKVTSTPTEYSTTPMPPDLKEDTHLEETASGSKADYEAIKMSQSEFDDTTVATTSTTSDPKADSKSAATLLESNLQISKSMADNKVAATVDRRAVATSSESKLDPEVAATPQAGPANHGSSSADEEKDTKQNDMPLEKLSSAPSTTPQLDPTEVNSRGTILLKAAFRKPEVSPSEHGSEVQDGPTAASQDKQETEKLPTPPSPQARSTLEDNLVLGVALDGSKRTLPIEEGATPPSPAEMKKMAACGTSSGSPAAKDKEGHALTTPGDQER